MATWPPSCPSPRCRKSSQSRSRSEAGAWLPSPRRRTTTCSTLSPPACMAASTMPFSGTSLPLRNVMSVVNSSREPLARHAFGQGAGAEAGEDYRVNGADAHGGQHQHDGLRAGGHIDGDAVALADAQSAQGGGKAAHFAGELGVGEHAPLQALVGVDHGGVTAPALRHVVIQAVVGQVGFPVQEPAEVGVVPLENAVPLAKPGQLLGGVGPERLGVRLRPFEPLPHDRIDQIHYCFLMRLGA